MDMVIIFLNHFTSLRCLHIYLEKFPHKYIVFRSDTDKNDQKTIHQSHNMIIKNGQTNTKSSTFHILIGTVI